MARGALAPLWGFLRVGLVMLLHLAVLAPASTMWRDQDYLVCFVRRGADENALF